MNPPSLFQALIISVALHGMLLMLPAGKVSGTPFTDRTQQLLKPASNSRAALMLTWKKQEAPARLPLPREAVPDAVQSAPLKQQPPREEHTPLDKPEPDQPAPGILPDPDGKSVLGSGYYFLRDEVERMPRILEDPGRGNGELERQLQSHASGGRLVLELWISEQGYVDRIDVLESTQTPELVQLMTTSFAKARFFPAQRQAMNVKSRLKIEVIIQPRWEKIELE